MKTIVKYLIGFAIINLTVSSVFSQKPNIILIVTDDQSFNSIGYTGGEVYTPLIDSLAGQGIKFTNAHVPSSVCSPSRYAVLTGKYPSRCQSENFLEKFPPGTPTRIENNVELTKDENHIARILGTNGYTTGFVGKSHIMDHDILLTSNWENFGLQTYDKNDNPNDPEVNAKMQANHVVYQDFVKSYGFDYADGIYLANTRELRNEFLDVHNIEWTVDAARNFIEQEKNNPFFLYFSTTFHHGPNPWGMKDGKFFSSFDADPTLTGEGKVDETWDFMPSRAEIKQKAIDQGIATGDLYATLLDEGIRAIYDKVVEAGIEDNTLIVFMPDHGSYRTGKATLYDFGIKVPMFMYWKGTITPGTIFDGMITSLDFAPTFADISNTSFEGDTVFDGMSLKNILETGTGQGHETIFAELGYSRMVKTEDYKYISIRYPDEVQEQIDNGFTFPGWEGSLLERPYLTFNPHLGHFASINNQLYWDLDQILDLNVDSAETVNFIEDNPQVLTELEGNLAEYLKSFDNRPYGEFTVNESDAPQRAIYPEPRSTRDDVIRDNVVLSWTSGGGAVSHNVYFGTSKDPDFIGNQTENTFDAGQLNALTTYYWRIDEVNGNGVTTGNTWSFTTQSDGLLLPIKKYFFNDVISDQDKAINFDAINNKDQDITVGDISIVGADASFFEIADGDLFDATLSSGEKGSFAVTYKPGTSGGNHFAQVVIANSLSNDTIDLIVNDVVSFYKKTIDPCDEIGAWTSFNTLKINNIDHKEGGATLEITGKETNQFQKKFDIPVTNIATVENAYLHVWYYVSDTSKLEANNQFEIGSGGKVDTDEFGWNIDDMLVNGWNELYLKFSDASTVGSPNINALNFIRVFHAKNDGIIARLDGIQIIDSTVAGNIESLDLPFRKYIFTNVIENEVRGQEFSLSNPSEENITINSIYLQGTNSDLFEITSDNISGESLAPSDSAEFTIEYNPGTNTESHSAQIVIESDLGTDIIILQANEMVEPIYRKTIDVLDMNNGWSSVNTLSINNEDHVEGGAALQMSGSKTGEFFKTFSEPIKTSATLENAYLHLWYYVSDISLFDSGDQIEIGSGGTFDNDEFSWSIGNQLSNGWNFLQLKFDDANQIGNPDVTNINWFRIYHVKNSEITTRIDGMQIVDSTVTTTSVQELMKDNGFTIAPNPSSGIINLDFVTSRNQIMIQVVDLNGRVVHEKTGNGTSMRIDLSHLNKGLFLIRMVDNSNQMIRKLIIN